MKLVRDTCEELQSSTFSILFHPIKEQLMTVDSAQMLGNSLRLISGVFSTGATGAIAPVILEQSITVTAL